MIAYQRATNELANHRAERRKAEIGFESKKRQEAEELRRNRQEERRDAKENREIEHHHYAMALKAERLEQLIDRKSGAKAAKAGAASSSHAPQLVKVEPSAA